MTSVEDDSTAPSFRFKRRKTTHTKRARIDDDAASTPSAQALDATTPHNAPEVVHDEEESVLNLREIIRSRKRPRDRLKEVPRKPEPQTELVQIEAPPSDQYAGRFAAQTGQVVDASDKQMSVYVEARLAEQNHRKYGGPIPLHLQSIVAATVPDLKHAFAANPVQTAAPSSTIDTDTDLSNRVAAGQGKLEEVSLAADSTRTHKDWARLEGTAPAPKVRMGRDGKPWRGRKRRNSNDIRRDAAVEAVLKEAKIDYFDDTTTTNPRFTGTDDDMVARFQAEYYESIEERQSRKPVMPPSAKDQPKGPKLGGSRSARAAMRERGEAAVKSKR
ncbi:uncharacterized protein M421DRAFT_371168 [Didymella exigua CBS 183.55]|uniref:Hepatocellular carcinoma-associated antigen 59-domain-containing protein n=1 Tax=Didymella exigua CBS 183.55 TaxID=1150837 RepID=A0A6A5RTF9_9PLEO|nr:uncharacterized protein M421DRAFT_371168 [Didymella exigua CBS 183.55]KAF1930308.1 hypothetical protein M421DRAFT_371168 [Didymella exigua CBS 183.55]